MTTKETFILGGIIISIATGSMTNASFGFLCFGLFIVFSTFLENQYD